MKTEYPYRLPDMRDVEFVELSDELNRPLMVVPRVGVRRLGLFRRVVLIALRDVHGRVFLQQRGPHCDAMAGFWDLSATGHIRAGEARDDAARRELEEELGITSVRMRRKAEHAPDARMHSFSTLYLAGPTSQQPVPNPAEVSGGMFVDAEELAALVAYEPDRITPALRWALGTGLLFERGMSLPERHFSS